jgi:undecaprenyl-diphosphatase
LAAILSVVTIYRKKFLDFKHYSFYIKLFIAFIPAVSFGLLLKKHIDAALNNLAFMAYVMVGGGIVLLFIDKFFTKNTIDKEENISNKNAFVVGCFQVLSIIFPGLSRSAATIIGGMSQKLTRSVAAEFSFFLAVPTMLAASVKSFWDTCKDNYLQQNHISEEQAQTIKIHLGQVLSKENLSSLFSHNNLIVFIVGCVVAYFVALIAIKFFIGYLQKHGFKLFGYYRIIIGTIIIALIATGYLK